MSSGRLAPRHIPEAVFVLARLDTLVRELAWLDTDAASYAARAANSLRVSIGLEPDEYRELSSALHWR